MTWNGIVSHDGHAIIAARQTTARTPQAVSTRLGRGNAIAGIPHRLDRLGAAELLAQSPHADVDDVRARIEAVAPHLRQEAFAAHDLAGMRDEVIEQPELAIREVDDAILDLRLPTREVELDARLPEGVNRRSNRRRGEGAP